MVKEEKLRNSIRAIHDLVVRGRNLAYEKHPHELIAKFLDHVEYLPALILEKEDTSDIFEMYLKGICSEFNFPGVMVRYNMDF